MPITRFDVLRMIAAYPYACLTEDRLGDANYCGFKTMAAAAEDAFFELNTSISNSEHELHTLTSLPFPPLSFGFFNYDLRCLLETVDAHSVPILPFPLAGFFKPAVLFEGCAMSDTFEISGASSMYPKENQAATSVYQPSISPIRPLQNREAYIRHVDEIKQKIIEGDVYEVNLCMFFEADSQHFDPVRTYLALTEASPMPYCTFLKWQHTYCLCASPELFLSHKEGKLTSRPIKGTLSKESATDRETAERLLLANEKERAENLMIVDLVRNDLNRSCIAGTVLVKELFGVYSFSGLYHMISTVEGMLNPHHSPIEGLLKCFPMGSMTGAPKISAMNTIDALEPAGRGLFSGAIGYVEGNGNFDFNVVIRSIFYNELTGKIHFMAGSAITIDADPEQEYEECMLKASRIIALLSKKVDI